MKTNATQRSLKELRDRGYIVHIVEKYIKHPNMAFGKRIDVWGFGDLLACHPWIDLNIAIVNPHQRLC